MQFLRLAVFMPLLQALTDCAHGGPASTIDFGPGAAAVTLAATTSQTEPHSAMLRNTVIPNVSMGAA